MLQSHIANKLNGSFAGQRFDLSIHLAPAHVEQVGQGFYIAPHLKNDEPVA